MEFRRVLFRSGCGLMLNANAALRICYHVTLCRCVVAGRPWLLGTTHFELLPNGGRDFLQTLAGHLRPVATRHELHTVVHLSGDGHWRLAIRFDDQVRFVRSGEYRWGEEG